MTVVAEEEEGRKIGPRADANLAFARPIRRSFFY